MTSTAIRQALRDWVTERNPAAQELRDDTSLITNRLVTSLQVTDLLLFIESLRGRQIEIECLTPGAFHDINTICSTFFRAGDEHV